MRAAWILALLFVLPCAQAEDIHFIVPGGAGGGWDATARGVGFALMEAGLVDRASFENISGAGGGKAIGTLIETADRQAQTLMVNSTPIIVRSVTNLFPFSYRDLTPIARIVGDYQVLVVREDSAYRDFRDVLAQFRSDPRSVKVAGGSVRGDLDHLAAALAFRAAGEDARKLAYVPYDAGGKALAGFLTGEGDVLSTGLGEALEYYRAGRLRIIAISAPERIATAADVPTYREQGVDFEFVNWRGFFAAPRLPDEAANRYSALIGKLLDTAEWERIRANNGWENLYLDRQDFGAFLAAQEQEIRSLLADLGFTASR